MAEQLDCSVATVSRICSAERRPSIDLILKIRPVLGWTIESQANALRESTTRYAVEFKERMERRRVPRGHART
jgi:transcriptional regulator with XRE-family HTH domain